MGAGSVKADAVPVIIVANHEMVRLGLRGLLEAESRFRVVASVPSAAGAVDELRRRRTPAVVIVDATARDLDLAALVAWLEASAPDPAVVVMVPAGDLDLVAAAVRAGIRGIVVPDVTREELVSVIDRALAGEHAIEASLATRLLVDLVTEHPSRPPEPLTPRETQILTMISRGHTNKEIAAQTVSAVGTVKVHVEHILAKLGVVDRTAAAVMAVELGIVGRGDDAGPAGDDRGHRPGSRDPGQMA